MFFLWHSNFILLHSFFFFNCSCVSCPATLIMLVWCSSVSVLAYIFPWNRGFFLCILLPVMCSTILFPVMAITRKTTMIKKKIMQHNLVTGISRKEYGYPISLFLFCYQAWIYKWAKLAADLQFRMFGYLVFLS